MKFRSKFTLGFTNRGCLHCAILEAYKATDMQFSFEMFIIKVFEILKFNMKVIRAA